MDDYQCKFPQILTVRVNQKNPLVQTAKYQWQ